MLMLNGAAMSSALRLAKTPFTYICENEKGNRQRDINILYVVGMLAPGGNAAPTVGEAGKGARLSCHQLAVGLNLRPYGARFDVRFDLQAASHCLVVLSAFTTCFSVRFDFHNYSFSVLTLNSAAIISA